MTARGFTLIELVVSVAIVGILAGVALPMAELAVKRSKEQELRAALREIRSAIDAYKQAADQGRVKKAATDSGYPPSLDILTGGVEDLRSPTGARIIFLRRLPRDPLAAADGQEAALTWGTRSYQSRHEAAEPGADVFDVYSRSAGRGMNGVAYREW